jgi:hypothetical protein
MWKTFSLASLIVSTILVCPVTQSHGFDLKEWIPSTESVKEALTTKADCVEVFDDSSESTSITCTPKNDRQRLEQTQQPKALKFLETKYDCVEVFDDSSESSSVTCTPKNNRQGLEQTRQRTQKTQRRVQQPASQQTRQQARQSLPNTLINCKEQKHIWNGKVNHELKKITHRYLIDHDEKRLRSIGENRPWRKWRRVLEFSDHLIRVKRINKKKVRVDTLTINRVTGKFNERRVISNEQALKSLGKPGVLKVSGSCEKIEATPKF